MRCSEAPYDTEKTVQAEANSLLRHYEPQTRGRPSANIGRPPLRSGPSGSFFFFEGGLIMTDEFHFHLDGSVVKQNCRVWGTEHPHEVEFRKGHSPHVTVWWGVASWGIVGPYLFEKRRRVVTVTGVRYRRMLKEYLLPQLQHRQVALQSVWFQQDEARPHTAGPILTRLQEVFPGKVLSKGGSVEWPPHSPDLSLPDFFL